MPSLETIISFLHYFITELIVHANFNWSIWQNAFDDATFYFAIVCWYTIDFCTNLCLGLISWILFTPEASFRLFWGLVSIVAHLITYLFMLLAYMFYLPFEPPFSLLIWVVNWVCGWSSFLFYDIFFLYAVYWCTNCIAIISSLMFYMVCEGHELYTFLCSSELDSWAFRRVLNPCLPFILPRIGNLSIYNADSICSLLLLAIDMTCGGMLALWCWSRLFPSDDCFVQSLRVAFLYYLLASYVILINLTTYMYGVDFDFLSFEQNFGHLSNVSELAFIGNGFFLSWFNLGLTFGFFWIWINMWAFLYELFSSNLTQEPVSRHVRFTWPWLWARWSNVYKNLWTHRRLLLVLIVFLPLTFFYNSLLFLKYLNAVSSESHSSLLAIVTELNVFLNHNFDLGPLCWCFSTLSRVFSSWEGYTQLFGFLTYDYTSEFVVVCHLSWHLFLHFQALNLILIAHAIALLNNSLNPRWLLRLLSYWLKLLLVNVLLGLSLLLLGFSLWSFFFLINYLMLFSLCYWFWLS